MLVVANNLEIRGVERKTNQKGIDYLVIHVEEENGRSSDLIDNNVEDEKYCIKGKNADFSLNINFGRYTNVRVSEIKIKEKM